MKHLMKQLRKNKGFTLVELLVVIAILGILAAGLLIAIDPVERINAANDTKVFNDLGSVSRALEAYAANNNGTYPDDAGGWATAMGLLTDEGAIKNAPKAPGGYTSPDYTYVCTGTPCDEYVLSGQVKSRNNFADCVGGLAACEAAGAVPQLRFESTGRACVVPDDSTSCPL